MQAENRKEELMQALYNELPTAYQTNTDTSSSSTNQNNNVSQPVDNNVDTLPFEIDDKGTLPFGDESSNPFSNNDMFSDDANFKDNDSDDDKVKDYYQKQGFVTGEKEPYKIDLADSNYTSQSEAFLQLIMGNNVFLSGPAGSGKSYIIDKYVDYVHKHSHKRVYVTSTTGLSALNVHGETIHAYSGQGVSLMPYEEMKKNPSNEFLWSKSRKKILNTDILIIDEVSMLSALQMQFLYDRLKDLLKERFNKLQVIVAGDFSQLPPVANKEAVDEYGSAARSFCYNTPAWNGFHFIPCYLDRIWRAKDTRLQQLLANIADGKGSDPANIRLLRKLKITQNKFTKGVPTLVSKNSEVNKINNRMQSENQNELYTNPTEYDTDVTSEHLKFAHKIAKKLGYEDSISLKVDDTVMITSNASEKKPFYTDAVGYRPLLKNGIIGTITDIQTSTNQYGMQHIETIGFDADIDGNTYHYDLLPYNNEIDDVKGNKIAGFTQFPLRLAYAISIHKSQGQTFTKIAIDLKHTWMPGLGYVALSRATNYDSISLIKEQPGKAWNDKALMINRASLNIRNDLLQKAYQLRQAYMPYYEVAAKDIRFIFENRDKLDLGSLLNASADYDKGELKELKDYQQ